MPDFGSMSLSELIRPEGHPCACGKVHVCALKYLNIGRGIVTETPKMIAAMGRKKPFVVCDENTWRVAGERVDAILTEAGVDHGLYVIPKGAQHMDLAYQFLNYICDPEVMAANLVDNPYSCPNDAAVAAASEEYRNGPAFDFDYKTNIFFQEDVGDAITIYDQYYQMLKVG